MLPALAIVDHADAVAADGSDGQGLDQPAPLGTADESTAVEVDQDAPFVLSADALCGRHPLDPDALDDVIDDLAAIVVGDPCEEPAVEALHPGPKCLCPLQPLGLRRLPRRGRPEQWSREALDEGASRLIAPTCRARQVEAGQMQRSVGFEASTHGTLATSPSLAISVSS
jgi:hypothetical protein